MNHQTEPHHTFLILNPLKKKGGKKKKKIKFSQDLLSRVKFHSPQNISGASQQVKVGKKTKNGFKQLVQSDPGLTQDHTFRVEDSS